MEAILYVNQFLEPTRPKQ